MPRPLPPGYELDDDRSRVDIDAVHRFVTEAYWAKGRSRDVVAALVAGATRVVGLYHDGEQVGFARVVSDGLVFAYLADVYVLEEHRGRGLGQAVVEAAVEGSELRACRWLLQTSGSQTLYERFGFESLTDGRVMGRPRLRRSLCRIPVRPFVSQGGTLTNPNSERWSPMLGRKDYTREELESCKVAIGAQLDAYRAVEAAVGSEALAGFEGPFFTNMVVALDRWFVHRVRAVSGKDGNPLNEVELIVDSVMTNGGVLRGNNVITYVPADSVLGLEIGDRISLTREQFERLSEAFLAEIERRFIELGG